MTGDDATLAVIDSLEKLGIPYLLVGSFSSNHYGVARGTEDADFVIQLGDQSISKIVAPLGADFRLDPQMSFETATLTKRHVVEIPNIPFKIEIFYLSDDPHDQQRFSRRRSVSLLGRKVWLPTAEDVIVTKLRWAFRLGRIKDQEDVRNVIAVQGEFIDWEYVHRWCGEHGTRALLDEIRRSIPPID